MSSFDPFAPLTFCDSDDSSVALLETASKYDLVSSTHHQASTTAARLLFHEKITATNTHWRGIHPLHSLEAHELNLPQLVRAALEACHASGRKPDLIAATRGPGMNSSLRTGLNLAKGLALAWNVPFIGAHHMQAHALTPRLEKALASKGNQPAGAPAFPFLSVLVSGGHTLLLQSDSLFVHRELAATTDIAIGVCLDKVARNILPGSVLDSIPDSGYARLLEAYAFPDGVAKFTYQAPRKRGEEVRDQVTPWSWSIKSPLIDTRAMKFSFSGIESTVQDILKKRGDVMDEQERRFLAQRAMLAAFEAVGSRVILALDAQRLETPRLEASSAAGTVVLSGGVASNQLLRKVLRAFLDIRGYHDTALVYPRPSLCTDNAAMIAWAASEIFEAGWQTELACTPISKWSLASNEEGGSGILEANGWFQSSR